MYDNLLRILDQEIDASRGCLTEDIIKLTSINSVDPTDKAIDYGSRVMLSTLSEMGTGAGLYVNNHKVNAISLSLKEGLPDLGIWIHGGTIPGSTERHLPPFDTGTYQNCAIDKGVDGIGKLASIFRLLKIFQKMKVPLGYNPALYVVGSGDDSMPSPYTAPGCEDAGQYNDRYTLPRLSLIPDGRFPVGWGGKGYMTIRFRGKEPLHDLNITAGQPHAPGKAAARFYGRSIIANSQVRHTYDPDPKGCMITLLMENLLGKTETAREDRLVLAFFKVLSQDIYGEQLGINTNGETLGALTVFTRELQTVDGYPELTAHIYYPSEITFERIVRILTMAAASYNVAVADVQDIARPYFMDKNQQLIHRLTGIANEVTGDNMEPYIVSGTTYAHLLPNALVYGMDGNFPSRDFPSDRECTHTMSENIDIDRLQRAMRIYARALLALNEMDW